MRKCFLIALLLPFLNLYAHGNKVVYDYEGTDITRFFTQKNTTYVIGYFHEFNHAVEIPEGCTIEFRGGHLQGKIVFNNTILAGDVKLRGSSVKGSVKNKIFNAAWLCAIDGETDDAKSINEVIDVCGHVFFPCGRYRLVSVFNSKGRVPQEYERSIQSHIGIDRNDVYLEGEQGATFVTNEALGTICVFSQPNQIENSITNVKIQGLTFEVLNNGVNFHEYMHTIKTIGVNGLQIENCFFNDFWGDAICLSHYGDTPRTGERTRNTNIRILNNSIVGGGYHNNRNGISIVSGKNVLIKGNIIRETSRKDMPGGIDIEPNNSAYTIDNIKIVGNTLEDIWGGGGAIGVCVFDGGPAHRIIIKNNVIKECIEGIQLYIMTDNTTSDILIKNNLLENVRKPFSFEGEGTSRNWTIIGNTYEMRGKQQIPGKIKVEKLVVKKNKKKE